MSKEFGREAESKVVLLDSGHQIPVAKLVCPVCGTMDTDTSISPPPDPRLEFEAKCPRDHTWRFFIDAR